MTHLLHLTFIICILSYIVLSTDGQNDPCSDFIWLDDPTRAVSNNNSAGGVEECDRNLEEAWYRYKHDLDINMPRFCPQMLQCGSLFPIWLDDTLPNAADGIKRVKVCQMSFTLCCESAFYISVKSCSGYNVYRLIPLDGCPGRYCFDIPGKCPVNSSSETGFEPCQANSPVFETTIHIEPIIPSYTPGSSENQLHLQCLISNIGSYQSNVFDIEWLIEGQKVMNETDIPFNVYGNISRLKRDTWMDRGISFGFQVRCRVRIRNAPTSTPSPWVDSNLFYAGVNISKTRVTIIDGEPEVIYLRPTVPVACVEIKGSRAPCPIEFEVYDMEENQDQAGGLVCPPDNFNITRSGCRVPIDGWRWSESYPMTIKAKVSATYNTMYRASIKMKSYTSKIDKAWSNYILPDIKVIVQDDSSLILSGRYCYSVNDPYIYQFDYGFFPSSHAGEFLLYKHTRKHIAIHTIQKGVDDFAVNCAVSIRAGADIFLWYGCEGRWIARRVNCDKQNNLEVFETSSGEAYQVGLPTGGSVVIYKRNVWITTTVAEVLNIYIYPSIIDLDQTTGLCGNVNLNDNDDFKDPTGNIISDVTEFSWSWRVPLQDSLFTAKSRESYSDDYYLCHCPNSLIPTPPQQTDCSWKESFPVCKGNEFVSKKCQILTKRESLDDDEEIDVKPNVVQGIKAPAVKTEWRNGWNETLAITACQEYMDKSPVYVLCKNVPHVNIDAFVQTCIGNIKLSATANWIESDFETILQSCLHEINMNATLWQKDSNNSISVAEAVKDVSCRNLCSGNGKCLNGVCQCHANFGGEDCSIDINMAPAIRGLQNNGLCDTAFHPCRTAFVFGGYFAPFNHLACRYKEIEVDESGVVELEKVTESTGDFENFNEIRCGIPTHSKSQRQRRSTNSIDPSLTVGFMISVSNNGMNFSSGVPVIIYDSSCTTCTVSQNIVHCLKKPNICIFEGSCYPITDPKCPANGNNDVLEVHHGLIIGVVCGVLGLGLVIGVILVFKHQIVKRTRIHDPGVNMDTYEAKNVYFKN